MLDSILLEITLFGHNSIDTSCDRHLKVETEFTPLFGNCEISEKKNSKHEHWFNDRLVISTFTKLEYVISCAHKVKN